jgi:hypothetical protein
MPCSKHRPLEARETTMNPTNLIPVPDTIPAPPWLFNFLDVALFFVHIVLVNIVVGTVLIALFSRFARPGVWSRVTDVASKRLPLYLPFAITLGIAPLLFVQVVYGHFFYTSSVLMASYWITVIPVLILGYYGIYFFAHHTESRSAFSSPALVLSTLCFLYIGFVYVNNFTLMLQPERWVSYFQNRSGTVLNLHDPTLLPRYFHFLIASTAVGGLFMAGLWDWRSWRESEDYSDDARRGLRVFGVATMAQLFVGLWFLISLPAPVMNFLLGGDALKTTLLGFAVLSALGAITTAFSGKVRPTVIQALVTILLMVITRYNVRTLYLEPYFSVSQLKLSPQYGVLALFLLVLLAGIASILYMVRISFSSQSRRQSSTNGIAHGGERLHVGGVR